MKQIFNLKFLALAFAMAIQPCFANRVCSTFWGCGFNMPMEKVEENLTNAGKNFVQGKTGNFFLADETIEGTKYAVCCMCFSSVDGTFYKLIGSNVYRSKEEASDAYEDVLSLLRTKYDNLQIIRHPEQAEKMCTYMDDDNAFYLGLYESNDKDGNKVFCVNVNYWNRYLSDRIDNVNK